MSKKGLRVSPEKSGSNELSHKHSRPALPLIVLPDISPRIVTGRKTLSSVFSPIFEEATRVQLHPFPHHYTGRRCRGAARTLIDHSNTPANSGAQSFQERKAA